ncbi:MAG: MerR family transcriptional regulator [Alphaproteobacteria bacterium]
MSDTKMYYSITEVAEKLDLPSHVLRFWETKMHQIQPMKRSGGRRFYREDDILILQYIQHLLHKQGYTIRGVQKFLKTLNKAQMVATARALFLGEALPEAPVPAAPSLVVQNADDRNRMENAAALLVLARDRLKDLQTQLTLAAAS